MATPAETVKRYLTTLTHRIHTLPVLTLVLHRRCDCRCIMCDVWQAGREGPALSVEEMAAQMPALERLGVRRVVLSGGEPLLYRDLWALCEQLRDHGVSTITLLTSGLSLARYHEEVGAWCTDVIVSLDGSPAVHDAIRNVPRAFERLTAGVEALKASYPEISVSGRCTIQRANYSDLHGIVQTSRAIGLDRISFMAADVSSPAFNRSTPWTAERRSRVALSSRDVARFDAMLEDVIAQRAADFASGFIAESPEKLRRLPRYFAALNGRGPFPAAVCNAPWVSAVVEADGSVRPCFFHRPVGTLGDGPLDAVLNAPSAVAFRRALDVDDDPTCRRCVCTLQLGARADCAAL